MERVQKPQLEELSAARLEEQERIELERKVIIVISLTYPGKADQRYWDD